MPGESLGSPTQALHKLDTYHFLSRAIDLHLEHVLEITHLALPACTVDSDSH